MYAHCNKCYRWHGPSGCPPTWLVARLDDGEDLDDVHPVYAADAEEAAEVWASDDDSASAELRAALDALVSADRERRVADAAYRETPLTDARWLDVRRDAFGSLKRFSAASEVPAGGGGALTADHSITAGVPRG